MTKNEATAILEESGATKEKRECNDGVTRSGWWLDSVWLAPINDPVAAVIAIRG